MQARVAGQRSGQQVRLAQDLEAVADAEHRQPRLRGGRELGHHRGEPGDGAAAQVVAVGEAAGQDHGVRAAQVTLVVPERDGLAAGPADRAGRLGLIQRAREGDDADARGHRAPHRLLRGTPEDYRLSWTPLIRRAL